MDRDRLTLLRTLALLRAVAVVGQAAAVYTATALLELALDPRPLYAGCAVLAVFAAIAAWTAWRSTQVGTGTVLAHVAVDLGVLTWMLYWSGGPANPFVSLYLLPIALVAFALRPPAVLAVALTAAGGYSLLMLEHVPIPHQHGDAAFFDLHLVGMWVNFLLSAALFTVFAGRLSALIGRQRRALARAREEALRSEGILAVATQAAATAHALNTPLSTMSTGSTRWPAPRCATIRASSTCCSICSTTPSMHRARPAATARGCACRARRARWNCWWRTAAAASRGNRPTSPATSRTGWGWGSPCRG